MEENREQKRKQRFAISEISNTKLWSLNVLLLVSLRALIFSQDIKEFANC